MLFSVIALVIAIMAYARIRKVEQENQSLRHMLQQLMNQSAPNPTQTEQLQPSQPREQPQQLKQIQPIQQPAPDFPPPTAEQKPQKNLENVFGKNVVGIIAAVLMFIGVFAFGTLVLTSMTDIIKVISSFVVSGAVAIAGLLWTKKNNTIWSNIVAGCGMGMIYISIFLTHLHYHMIGNIATFALIFAWAIGVIILARKFTIPSLSYLALTGCVISSLLAQVFVVEQHMFIEMTVYHCLTFLLLIIANKENTLLFNISSYCASGLNLVLSSIIVHYAQTSQEFSWIVLCFILGMYNLAICVMTYRESKDRSEVDTIMACCTYAINLICTGIIPFSILLDRALLAIDNINTFLPTSQSALSANRAILFHIGLIIIIAAAYAVYHFFIHNNKKRNWILITTEIVWGFIALVDPIEIAGKDFSLLLLLPILNFVLAKLSHDIDTKRLVYWSGFTFFIADAVTSLFFIMDFGWYGVLHSVALFALSAFYMYEGYGFVLQFPFMQSALINGHLLWTLLNVCDNWTVAVIIVVLLNMGWSALVQLYTNPPKVSAVLTEITESLLAFVVFWLVLDDKAVYPVGCYLLSVLLIPFMLTRLKNVIQSKNAFISVWYGLKFTFYTFGTLEMFTGFTDQQFIVSVVLMILASACIVFGFWKEMKALRVYGLALILSSVAKMVIIDVWNQESIVRVLALIAGALICFGISAVYTKIESKQSAENNK